MRQIVGVLPSREATRSMAARRFFLAPASLSKASNSCKRQGRQHRAGPGAEILGRDVAAGDLLQVGVHVGRGDVFALAVLVHVLEQVLAGQFLAGLDDLGDAPVLQLQPPGLAALALELEAQLATLRPSRAGCAGWSGRSSCWSWRSRRCRPGSAWSPAGAPRWPAPSRAAGRAAPCARRAWRGSPAARARTPACARTWCSRAPRGTAGGSWYCLRPLRVAPGRLDVAVGLGADPHVGPGRRNRQLADALQRAVVAHRFAVRP